jgi:hypothetical protein
MEARLKRTVGISAFAAAGVLTGHVFDYVTVFPEPHLRAAVLRATGHAYFGHLAVTAFVLCFVVAGLVFVSSMRADAGRATSFRALALAIGVTQTIGFSLLEISERLISGVPLGRELILILAVGFVLQIGVASVAALLLTGLEVAGRALGRVMRRRIPKPSVVNSHHLESFIVWCDFALRHQPPRGPPVLSRAH